jgi:hypothetical protein
MEAYQMMLRTLANCAIAATSTLTVLAVTTAASAEPHRVNLGPVGPYEPILATVGEKRVIAYYTPDDDSCAVSAVVFDKSATGGGRASARARVTLRPGEVFHLDSVEEQILTLACGRDAKTITVVNRGDFMKRAARIN